MDKSTIIGITIASAFIGGLILLCGISLCLNYHRKKRSKSLRDNMDRSVFESDQSLSYLPCCSYFVSLFSPNRNKRRPRSTKPTLLRSAPPETLTKFDMSIVVDNNNSNSNQIATTSSSSSLSSIYGENARANGSETASNRVRPVGSGSKDNRKSGRKNGSGKQTKSTRGIDNGYTLAVANAYPNQLAAPPPTTAYPHYMEMESAHDNLVGSRLSAPILPPPGL